MREFDVDAADPVLLALIDGDRDDIAAGVRVELRIGGDDAEIGIAVLQVIAADELQIGGEPVRIVDVRALEEAQKVGLGGRHDAAQAARRKLLLPTKRISLTPVLSPSLMV